MDLTVTTQQLGGCALVEVEGEIDVYTAPRLREKLNEATQSGQNQIVVDLDAVGFLDSTGLGVLVGVLKRVRADDGWVRLVCSQERLLKILRITGLAQVFAIFDSVDAALSADDATGGTDVAAGARPARTKRGASDSDSARK